MAGGGKGGRVPPPTFDPLQRMGAALPIPATTTPLLVWQHQTPLQNSAPSPLCPTTLPIKGRREKGKRGRHPSNAEKGSQTRRGEETSQDALLEGRRRSTADRTRFPKSTYQRPKKTGGEKIRGPPYVLPPSLTRRP